nr:bifunctional epoxide hydrolase 2-like [Tanacetum cinerariifolium]
MGASKGYRAIAPDLRGYGDTEAPRSPTSYTAFHIVGDLVSLLDSLGLDEVYLVGHDWGAIISWYLCLFRPDRIKALVNMSVVYTPRDPLMLFIASKGYRAIAPDLRGYGDTESPSSPTSYTAFHIVGDLVSLLDSLGLDEVYLVGHDWGAIISCKKTLMYCYCQQEIGWEQEFAKVDTKRQLAASYCNRNPSPPMLPKDYAKNFNPPSYTLPSWFTEEDLDYFASKYRATGFTGGFNYYRCFDLNWELCAAWMGSKIMVPVKFIVGDLDLTYHFPGAKEYIHGDEFKKLVPGLEEVVVMEGVGHFINQEKPQEINNHIYDFITKF